MADVRVHRYRVDEGRLDEFLARRSDLIGVLRNEHPGLIETRLVRVGDTTFLDIWRWRSSAEMQAGLMAAPSIPEVGAAMSLTRERTAEDGELLDER
jgi:Antibiotic biosynthesis monooxygenase